MGSTRLDRSKRPVFLRTLDLARSFEISQDLELLFKLNRQAFGWRQAIPKPKQPFEFKIDLRSSTRDSHWFIHVDLGRESKIDLELKKMLIEILAKMIPKRRF